MVWVEDDPEVICSKMFDDEKGAVAFAKSKEDYLIFGLIHQEKMETFSWKLLPYGRYQPYRLLIPLYRKHKKNILNFLKNIL